MAGNQHKTARQVGKLFNNRRQVQCVDVRYPAGYYAKRNADRIAQQREELDRLTKERDALLKK